MNMVDMAQISAVVTGSRLIKSALVLVIAIVVDRVIIGSVIKRLIRAAEKYNEANAPKMRTLFSVLRTLAMVIIYFIAAIFIMQILFDVDATSIVAATGVVGVVAGLGAQSIVRDSISGFFILLEDQYAVGDLVTVDDFTGYVESVTIRTTVVKGFEGERLIIPNGNMTRIINHSRDDKRALIRIHIAYDESVDRAIDIVRGALATAEKEMERLTAPAFVAGVDELGPLAVQLLIVAPCETGAQYEVKREILRRIKTAFDENKIKMPFTENNNAPPQM